jgi:hypothetical protein
MLRFHVLAIRPRVMPSGKVSNIADPASANSVTKKASDDLIGQLERHSPVYPGAYDV